MKRALSIFLVVLAVAMPTVAQDSKENADFKLAVNLYNDKLYDLAVEQFRQFINLYPNTQQGIDARFYLGMTQMKLGKFDDARFTFQNFALAYPEHPRSAEAWMNVGDAYLALKNDREAAVAFERVKTFQPKSKFAPVALLRASEYYEKNGDRDDALRVLRVLTQDYTTPEALSGRIRLAEFLLAGGDYEQARLNCRVAADGTTDATLRGRALTVMGRALLAMNRSKEAEAAFEEVVTKYKSGKSTSAAVFELARVRYAAGNVDEAMAGWRKVADDSVGAPRQLRQDALLEMGKANERVREYSRAADLDTRAARIGGSRTGEAWYRAGVALESMKDTVRAAGCYAHAWADSGKSVDSRATLAAAFRADRWQKDFSGALRLADEFVFRFPDDPVAPRLIYEAGLVALNDLSDFGGAIQKFDAVAMRFPKSVLVDDALYARGIAERRLGNIRQAISDLERLCAQYPASELVPRARADIDWMRAYEMPDRQGGVQKLALLIGDVIAGKPRGILAYRLAEISFRDLNDYALAAAQYRSALEGDLPEADKPAAWFSLGRSLELLAARTSSPGDASLERQARDIYDSLAILFPRTPEAKQAKDAAVMLRMEGTLSLAGMKAVADSLLRDPGSYDHPAVALARAGRLMAEAGKYDSALLVFDAALRFSPDPGIAADILFGQAQCLNRLGRSDSAALRLRRCVEKYPDTRPAAEGTMRLLSVAADSGDVAQADALAEQIAQRYFYSFDDRGIAEKRAFARFASGKYSESAAIAQRALDGLRSDWTAPVPPSGIEENLLFLLAACYEKSSDGERATQYYSDYVTRDQSTPRAAQAYYALAGLAKAAGDPDRAERFLRSAGKISAATGTSVGNVTLETAELLFQAEKYREAGTKYGEVAAQTKNDTLRQYALQHVVLSLFRADQIAEADKKANAYVKAYPKAYNEAAEFDFERGRYALRREDPWNARQRFENVRRSYPKAPIVPEALYWLARSYELDQKFPLAVSLYDSMLKAYPKNPVLPRVRLSLGNALYNLEQWDGASQQFRALLDHEDESPDLTKYAMSNLIMTYKEMQMYDAALELTRKYIERFPNEPDAIDKRIDIGVLYEKLGYYDQAIVHLESILQVAPPDLEAELRYYLGEAHYGRGEYQQAILEFLKVPYLVSRAGKMDWTATSYYMAGQSYEKMAKYDQAILMYKQIVDRKETDAQFRVAAQKEIDRVRTVIGSGK